MIIFVEGVDGSGKTTLIQQLSDRYTNVSVSRMEEDSSLWSKLINFAKSFQNKFILVDRSPLTEYVYRAEDRKESKFPYSAVVKWLKQGKIIYCNNNDSFENAMKRGEDNITIKSRHDKIRQFYDTFIPTLESEGVKVMYYNWQENCLDDVIKFIEGGN